VSATAAIRLVTWGNAWLAGLVPLDDVVDGVRGPEVAHTFTFPPQDVRTGPYRPLERRGDDTTSASRRRSGPPVHSEARSSSPTLAEAVPVALAMGELRRRGAAGLHLALPIPGDPAGFAGPPASTGTAVDAGQAAIIDGAGFALVPDLIGSGVQWAAVPADPPTATASRAEAEREMSEQLLIAARGLAELDVARWNPGLPAALAGPGATAVAEQLPPTMDPRRSGLIARAGRLQLALQIALAEDGGARTLSESRRRRELLEPLERVVRRALIAACAPDPEAPGPR